MANYWYFPVLFVLLWSTGFIGARMGMPYAEPFSFLSVRYILALVFLGGLALVAGAPWPGARLALHCMVVGLLLHGIYLGSVFWSIDHGLPPALAAMIVGLQPITAALFAGMTLGEKNSTRTWIGLLIGVVGLGLVLGPKLGVLSSGVTVVNIAVCVGAMLAATLGTIYQKKYATSAPLRSGTFWQYAGALLPTIIYAALFETQEFELNGEVVFAMLWLVLVLSIGAVFLLMMLIRDGSVSKVSSLLYLVPASTAVIAYFLFDEALGPIQLVGMVVCALGVRLAMAAPAEEAK